MLHPRDRPTVEKKNRHLVLGCQVTGNLPRIRDLVHLPHSATVDCREPSTKIDGKGEILRDEPPHGDNCPRTSQCAYSGSAAQFVCAPGLSAGEGRMGMANGSKGNSYLPSLIKISSVRRDRSGACGSSLDHSRDSVEDRFSSTRS